MVYFQRRVCDFLSRGVPVYRSFPVASLYRFAVGIHVPLCGLMASVASLVRTCWFVIVMVRFMLEAEKLLIQNEALYT